MTDNENENRTHKTIEQAEKEGKYIRKVRSFVKREGRLTNAQGRALEEHWSTMGLNHSDGLLDFAKVFGNNNPVVLEIGFGMGKSLVEMAKAAPELNFIGIEVHRPGVGACIATAQENNVTNLKVYEHDAIEILADCIPAQSLTTVQLFFPDPWHKTRHHKRRLINEAFIEDLHRIIRPGGTFRFASDIIHYVDWTLTRMHRHGGWDWTAESHADWTVRPDDWPGTRYEAKAIREGRVPQYFKFIKLDPAQKASS